MPSRSLPSIPKTFNHSKIVAGDGVYALVGGHNMAEEVSSNTAPVIHDMTCEVTGPGARSANAFAGSLWVKTALYGTICLNHYFGIVARASLNSTMPSAALHMGFILAE